MSFLEEQGEGGGRVGDSGKARAESETKLPLVTIELGFGQDAPADGESVFPIADVEGRDRWMMGHLTEEKHRRCNEMKQLQLI